MEYSIQNKNLRIVVDSKGAELVSVKHKGNEKIWQNQNGSWAGHAPMLFPVCGHFSFIYNGKDYQMPTHGFARKAEFSLMEKKDKSITFCFSSNEATKEVYPFDFLLFASYALKNDSIVFTVTVKNTDIKPVLFCLGGHESYMLEMPLENYKLVFPKEEKLVHYPHDEDGYLTGERVDFGVSDTYAFTENDLLNGDTLIFKDIQSGEVKLCTKTGEEVYDVHFNGFKNLLLWRPIGAQMVCIEPWLNLPDTQGDKRAFFEKEGIVKIPVGEEKTFIRIIEYK